MKIEVVKNTKLFFTISTILIALSLVLVVAKNFNYGIDFTGGNIFQLRMAENLEVNKANEILDSLVDDYDFLNSRRVQVSEGNILIVRTMEVTEEQKTEFLGIIKEKLNVEEVLQVDKVGSVIGKELKWKAINALLVGAILIVIYITLRFEFRFALGAIAALLHDIIIAIGIIILLGYEINTPFIAAILTLLGYSINDTIVVYDRIRENMNKMEGSEFSEVINTSINQVLTRSINTSLTTLLAIIALLIFGGASLQTFTTTLLIGVIVGTYSSIFVATPLVSIFEKGNKHILDH